MKATTFLIDLLALGAAGTAHAARPIEQAQAADGVLVSGKAPTELKIKAPAAGSHAVERRELQAVGPGCDGTFSDESFAEMSTGTGIMRGCTFTSGTAWKIEYEVTSNDNSDIDVFVSNDGDCNKDPTSDTDFAHFTDHAKNDITKATVTQSFGNVSSMGCIFIICDNMIMDCENTDVKFRITPIDGGSNPPSSNPPSSNPPSSNSGGGCTFEEAAEVVSAITLYSERNPCLDEDYNLDNCGNCRKTIDFMHDTFGSKSAGCSLDTLGDTPNCSDCQELETALKSISSLIDAECGEALSPASMASVSGALGAAALVAGIVM